MARIPQEEIDRIKHEVRLEDLVRARGVELKAHGNNLLGLCPFHDDHEPSLVVTPSKNLWHCLGACQAGGDVFAWVQKSEGVSFRHAYELLASRFYVVDPEAYVPKKASIPKLSSPFSLEMDDEELKTAYVDYSHEELKRSPEVMAYLEKRGLTHPELAPAFRLGFANRTLGLRLPAKGRKEGDALRSRLQTLGILRPTGHEHLNGCLIVPVIDEEGRVAGIYGRKITARLTAGLAHHLYLPGPHRGVWNAGSLGGTIEGRGEERSVILCEAAIDAMTFWCAGYRNVTWSYGVEGFTADHLAAFHREAVEHVLIAYDRDEAGDRAAAKLGEKLIGEGFDVSRVRLPHGLDVNAYALKVGPATKSLGLVLRSAEWVGKGRAVARSSESVVSVRHEASSLVALAAKNNHEAATKEENQAAEAVALRDVDELPAESALPQPVPVPMPDIPLPEPDDTVPMKLKGDEVVLELGDRRYRIRGLAKNTSYESLKVNVLATREGLDERVFMDTFDLALAKQRTSFEKQTAAELGVREEVVHHDMGQVLKALEILREKQIEKALAPKTAPVVISPEEHAEAMHLLRSPDLVQKIVTAFDRCGLVGERTNKLVAYLAAVSRKLDDPLAVIVQSSSAAGKTALMDAVLALMPKEERVRYSAMTGKALFYITETSLKHKILAISEEEGAEQASYALKLLQSEGELTIASTGKDPATGKLVTQEYHIEGPVMIIVTTTKIDIDEELLNRCIVLTVDENREQTRAIHQVQREMQTLEGLLAKKESDHIRRVHQNAQRLLKPVHVVNPYARELTFLDARTRTRRDHMKYLTLIRSVALLHQFQRPRKSAGEGESRIEYIEVTREDIALANGLAHEVLGRSLDELPPQTRRLLHLVDDFVTAECRRLHMKRVTFRFSRRHIREWTGWGDTQLKVHLHRLEELEYLLVHRGGRGQSFVYEMLYDGEGRERTTFLSGLIDVAKLGEPGAALANRSGLEDEKSGSTGEKSGSGRPLVGPGSGGSRGAETELISNPVRQLDPEHVETSLDALLRDDRRKTVSYILKSRKDGNGRDTTPRAFFRRDRVNVIRALQRKRNEQP